MNPLSLRLHFIPWAYHPLFSGTVCLMTGIWWAQGVNFFLPTVFIIISGTCIGFTKNPAKTFFHLCIAWASFIGGAWNYQNQFETLKSFEQQAKNQNCYTGTIEDIQFSQGQKYPIKLFIGLDNHAGKVMICTRQKNNLRVGDQIGFGPLMIPATKNEKFRLFLLKENILGCMHMPKLSFTLLTRPCLHFGRLCHETKERINNALKKKLSYETFALWGMLFLGSKEKGPEIQKLKISCQQWGISHYLARSGLHLMIFIFVWFSLLKVLPISMTIKHIALLILVLLYAALSTLSLSFNRALIMYLLYTFCKLQNLEIRALHMVCLAAFMTLLASPASLFFLDFQLSYGMTAALTFFFEIAAARKFLKKE